MAEDGGGKWRKVIIIVVVIIVILMLLIGLFVGFSGLKSFFTFLFGAILFLGIIFGLLYIFWLVFIKKSYVDIPATFKKKLVSTAKLMKNDMLGELYLSGDSKHNRVTLGKYLYMRVTLPRQIQTETGKDDFNKPIMKEHTEGVPVDCFLLQKKGIMDTLFSDPIFVLVKPEDHDYSSIFNDVTINGFNLVPLDSQFYTIDRRNLDIDIIKGMATNYIREVVYTIFQDLDRLVKQAMNLDHQFQKDKQRGLEFELPNIGQMGGQNK